MANFDENIINKVWEKATICENNDSLLWRKDFAGAWIRRDLYGIACEYGWEIDHMLPVSKGGLDDLDNLIPMNWRNNRKKGDNYPAFESAVTSNGVHNKEFIESWKIE